MPLKIRVKPNADRFFENNEKDESIAKKLCSDCQIIFRGTLKSIKYLHGKEVGIWNTGTL